MDNYRSALQEAVVEGNIERVKELLENGADVNAQGGEYGTALQTAAGGGNIEVVEVLLENGANVNARGGYYGSAFQAAVVRGNTEIVEVLLKGGADVSTQGGRYGSVPQTMEKATMADTASKTVDKPEGNEERGDSEVDQDDPDHNSNTDSEPTIPTDQESSSSRRSSASSITSAGSLQIPATQELVDLLLNHNNLHPLYEEAIKRVNPEKFERHLRRFLRAYGDHLKNEARNEVQIRASDFVRQSARRAAREIKLAILKPMESRMYGASSQQAKGRERLNLLLRSTQKSQATNTEESDSESDNSDEGDPLRDDNKLQALDEVRDFLTSAEAFTTLCQSLRSWLKLADRDVSTVRRLLLNEGADVKETDKDGRTPLHDTAGTGSEGPIHQLLNKGIDIKATDKDGRIPLHNTARTGSEGPIHQLLDKGTDIRATNNNVLLPRFPSPQSEPVMLDNVQRLDLESQKGERCSLEAYQEALNNLGQYLNEYCECFA